MATIYFITGEHIDPTVASSQAEPELKPCTEAELLRIERELDNLEPMSHERAEAVFAQLSTIFACSSGERSVPPVEEKLNDVACEDAYFIVNGLGDYMDATIRRALESRGIAVTKEQFRSLSADLLLGIAAPLFTTGRIVEHEIRRTV